MTDSREAFIIANRDVGIVPIKPLKLLPGALERFGVEGDKSGSRNGWAILHDGPAPFGAYGSWRTGESHTWKATTNERMNPAQRAEHRRQIEALRAARAEDEARTHAEAARRAVKLWNAAKPATNDHPYLQAKNVPAYGLKSLRDQIIVPARDASALFALQDEDGAC